MSFQEEAKDAIRASGGRITTQREILLDLLAGIDGDIDADALHQRASAIDPNISVPTVYRTLHTLEDAQIIISRYASQDHERKLYHRNENGSPSHLTFTCSRCGRRTSFQSSLIQQLKQDVETQFAAELSTLCLCASGLCAECREEEEQS
jgi:Fe2+ or Zn2+ uptake regulation protein